MQGNSYSSNNSNAKDLWISENKFQILDHLYEAAQDFLESIAMGKYDGRVNLGTVKWQPLHPDNKKEGYKGRETQTDKGWPSLFFTYNNFKCGGYTATFGAKECNEIIHNLWQANKDGYYEKIKSNKIEEIKRNRAEKLKKLEEEQLSRETDEKNALEKDKKLWDELKLNGISSYLKDKKLHDFNIKGIRYHRDFIAVKIINTNNEFCGLQKIFNNTSTTKVNNIEKRVRIKLFTKGLKKKGCFAVIGDESLPRNPKSLEFIFLCEGVATAATIHKATGEIVFAGLDAYNMESVTKALKKKYPTSQIIIWADNDQWNADSLDPQGNRIGNTGLIHANFAAMMARNALIATPDFSEISNLAQTNKLTDFNDLYVYQGLEAVASATFQKPNINLALEKKIKKSKKIQHGILSRKRFNNAQKIVINSKYIEDFHIQEGVNLIKSPIGTGKTELVKTYLDNNKNKSVLFVTYLVSLVEDAAKRLNLKSYQDCDDYDLQIQRKISICLNSLFRLNSQAAVPDYDVLIIDEIEQVLNRLTTEISNKVLVFEIFRYLVKNCKTVICLDAHLSEKTVGIIKKWCDNKHVNILFNEYAVGNKRDIIFHDSKESLQTNTIDMVKSGKKAYLAFNSKEELKKFKLLIDKTLPNKKGLMVCSENNDDDETNRFFKDINLESKKYDYVLCSPSVTTGVSIINNHFDYVAGIFSSGINTPNDCMQAIGRVRNSKEIHVFTEKNTSCKTTDEKVLASNWKELFKYDLELLKISDKGERIVSCEDYEYLKIKTTQHKNIGLNDFYYEFCLLAVNDSYNLRHSDHFLSKEDSKDIKDIKKYLYKITNKIDILKASHIDGRLANIIENKSRKKLSETVSFKKHKLIDFYKLNKYDEKEICNYLEIDDNGKFRSKVLNLELALSDTQCANNLFNKQLKTEVQFRADLNGYATRQKLYRNLFIELKLLDEENKFILNTFEYGHKYNKDSLRNSVFIRWVIDNFSKIRHLIPDWTIEAIFENPIKLISCLLNQVGLKQKATGKTSKGYYVVDTQQVHTMISVLDKRHFFEQGKTCAVNVIINSTSLPEVSVPKVLENLRSVVDSYAHHLSAKLDELKKSLQGRVFRGYLMDRVTINDFVLAL